jgi:hypothetical protein
VSLIPGMLVLTAAITPLSAMKVPHSRQEFVEAVVAGVGASKMEKLVVERTSTRITPCSKENPPPTWQSR